jgi:peptide/nickel transport system permease protein
MTTYIIRRLIQAVVLMFIVSLIIFALMRLLPGDPIQMLVDKNSISQLNEQQIEAIRHDLGLDKSVPLQYVDWVSRMLRGDFGKSMMQGYSIGEELKRRIPVSLTLGFAAFILGLVIGPLLGIISAIRRGKLIDNIVTVFANIGITAPEFWIAIILLYVFAVKLQMVPLYGWTPPWVDLGESIRSGILPVFVAALAPIASSARQARSSVLETLGEDYVRTAWAKGLNERKVLTKHVIKNSLMPVLTLQGLMLRMVLGGSVIVETIFAIPGMGNFMINGLLSYDYTIVQGVSVVMTLITVLSSLIIDLLYVWVDPRIQYD